MTDWQDRPTGVDGATGAGATGEPEVDALVEEIEVTRVEMTGTVEQIGDRLDPKNIVADAKETVRDATVGKVEQMANTAEEFVNNAGQTAQQAGSGLVESVRRNPIPAAMVGIGLGWLAMSARQSGGGSSSGGRSGYGYDRYAASRYGDIGTDRGTWDTGRMGSESWSGQGSQGGIGQRVGQVGDTAGQAVSDAQQRVGQVADDFGRTAGQVPQQVQGVARQAGDNVGRMFDENPLAVGAIAVAVGTAIGMALPATRMERNVIGEPAQNLIGKAEDAATQALDQAEQTARQAEDEAREEDRKTRSH